MPNKDFSHIVLLFVIVILYGFSPISVFSAEEDAGILSYALLPGIDLIFTATLDTIIEGPYSEQSTRMIESRIIRAEEGAGGEIALVGISSLHRRILEGQEVKIPFENREAYRFRMNRFGSFSGYDSAGPELGTGWSPMIHFPPLANESIPLDTRMETKLPVQGGFPADAEGRYSLLIRHIEPQNQILLIGAGLSQPVTIPGDPPILVRYQEYEIRFDLNKRLPVFSRTSTQSSMDTPNGTFQIETVAESQLNQANIFPSHHLPVIRGELTDFFHYKIQLQLTNFADSYPVLQKLLTFADHSPVPFLRETAKDVVDKYRFNMQLEKNRDQAMVSNQAPDFSGESLQGQLIRFPPEKRKPTVMLFWALWWEPAERELWHIETLYRDYRDKAQIIGINLDSARGIARRYIEQSGIQTPILWDEGYPQSGIAFRYGVHTVPTVIVMDKKGKMAAIDVRGRQLTELLDKLAR
ncbi:MAG: TlpA family protein disulfide reductase [Candidatus Omnitrophota bacterium]|jgi:peroxiredoxin|nr:MAG: TlpA family protein disulfide reductase [Candidatus Omnitrophota bacterium]